MNSKLVTLSVGILFLFSMGLFAQDFTRLDPIEVPETELNNGGWGAMIAGVDLDGDGNKEIYLTNDNWNDGATEVIPRIYKLEQNGQAWDVVWKAVAPVAYQNTWPPLVLADLDGDGKKELVWLPINSTSIEANPLRILVYEHLEGDIFGVATSDTNSASGEPLLYAPNASWTIFDTDGVNFRPTRVFVHDLTGDGKDEIIIADRAGESATGGNFFAVISVSDIPDNGDGSETWTLEVSGADFLYGSDIFNKWDAAMIDNRVYFFCEGQITKLTYDGGDYVMSELSPLAGGTPFLASQTVDLDNDNTKEIITGIYDWGDDAHKAIVLIQESGDTLTHTELFNLGEIWPSGSRGIVGSAMGDIDGDGFMDFIFGSRASTPNAAIMRLAYRGGDITNPANYEFSIIDSLAEESGVWNVIALANIDDDPALEVLYTSSTPAGGLFSATQPIFVLDYTGETGFVELDELVIAGEVLFNGAPPEGLFFKPGRILDENTIWFSGNLSSLFGDEIYVFRSIDGGKTFTHNTTPIPGRAAQMDAFDENIALVATAEGAIHRTTDGGTTWEEVYSYTNGAWFDGLRILGENVAVAYGDGESNGYMHFVRTEDKGATWTEIDGIDFMNAAYGFYTWGLAACNVGASAWYSATTTQYDSSYVFRTYDAGLTWDSFVIPKDVIPTYPRAIAFSDDNNGLIADRQGNVVKSVDGGATWSATNMPSESSDSWVNGVVAIPNSDIIMGMDDIGVFFTSDLGATWHQVQTPPETDEDDFVSGVFLNKNFGYVFTYNGQILRFKNQVTSIHDQFANTVPAEFHLFQNYPNPFNPTTQISFLMPQSAEVKVVIYDMLGRKVRTVFEGHKGVGLHTVTWDGKNDFGLSVASGTYIYNLVGKDVNISRRMQFVK